MALTREQVARIAVLARIKVPAYELDHLAGELDHILGWIEQLGEVDTSGVEPMSRVVEMTLPMREDVVTGGEDRADVLANGPEATEAFFTVPKVVE